MSFGRVPWIHLVVACTCLAVTFIVFPGFHYLDNPAVSSIVHSISCWDNADPMIHGVELPVATLSETDTLRFFVVGDWGVINAPVKYLDEIDQSIPVKLAHSMNRYASKHRTHFIVSLGDHFYPHGVNSTDDPRWKTSYKNTFDLDNLRQLRWYSILGNHDISGNKVAVEGGFPESNWDSYPVAQIKYTNHNSRWCMPSYYYSFSFKLEDFTATFIGIDTNILTMCSKTEHPYCRGPSLSSPDITRNMLIWLEDQLKRSSEAGHVIIVFGHSGHFD